MLGQPRLQRLQPGAPDPVGESRAIELDALPGEDLALPVKGKVIAVLGDQNMPASTARPCRCRGGATPLSRTVREETAFDRAASAEGAQEEGRREPDCSRAALLSDDHRPAARGCGRLGLCTARPAHSPSRRASFGSR
jgi:hypothetical protein